MHALNRCCECGLEWRDRPAGFAEHDACPRCASPYWEWLDYEQQAGSPEGPAVAAARPRVNLLVD